MFQFKSGLTIWDSKSWKKAQVFDLSLEFSKIIENDMDEDGRLSFEEFFQVMKSNKKLNKLILKIANAWLCGKNWINVRKNNMHYNNKSTHIIHCIMYIYFHCLTWPIGFDNIFANLLIYLTIAAFILKYSVKPNTIITDPIFKSTYMLF